MVGRVVTRTNLTSSQRRGLLQLLAVITAAAAPHHVCSGGAWSSAINAGRRRRRRKSWAIVVHKSNERTTQWPRGPRRDVTAARSRPRSCLAACPLGRPPARRLPAANYKICLDQHPDAIASVRYVISRASHEVVSVDRPRCSCRLHLRKLRRTLPSLLRPRLSAHVRTELAQFTALDYDIAAWGIIASELTVFMSLFCEKNRNNLRRTISPIYI